MQLVDTSLATRGTGGPQSGDAWTLRFSDADALNGDGIAGDLNNQSFDGSIANFSLLLATLFNGEYLHDLVTSDNVPSDGGATASVPGWVGTGTQYAYTGTGGGEPAGLVTETQNATATINSAGALQNTTTLATTATNVYYSSGDYNYDYTSNTWIPNPGASYGQLDYTTNAAGQETYYAYDQSGRTILQYVYKTWTDGTGNLVSGWVGTSSVYDSSGRLTDTYQATYKDPDPSDSAYLDGYGYHILPVIDGGVAGIQVNTSVDPVYSAPQRTQHIDYNSLGQQADTIDQYGGKTSYTYDAFGNVIRTVYPNGTETLSVYDLLNRAIWTTNQFDPNNPSTCVLTRTVYNQLGQVVETDQYMDPSANDLIQIGTRLVGSASVSSSTISTTADDTPIGSPVGWTLASTTKTFYDAAGNAIETIRPSGLRTGSIYYPDGKVGYTGPLASSAPDGGHVVTTYAGVTSNAFTTSDFQVDSSTGYTQTLYNQYNPTLGLFYTRSIDQNGHHTDTYTDAENRTVRTVYNDGSYTETLYGIGDNTVAYDQEGDPVPLPTNWSGIPSDQYGNGSETVAVAQRIAGAPSSSDPLLFTYDVYDGAGNLTDVYQPAVADMDPNSPTYALAPGNDGRLVNPHWHYDYDSAGNEIDQISPTGRTTTGDPSYTGNTTLFAYDQNGNQVEQTLPDDSTLPDGQTETETWTYDIFGNEATFMDFDGNEATYTYATSGAEEGLLQQVVYGAATGSGKTPQTVTYHYNDLGQQASVTDASGTTTSTYDAFGNLIESDTPEGDIHYVFDPATQNHTETYTGDTKTFYGYDTQGRLTSAIVEQLNGSPVDLETDYTYDPAGNELTEKLPDGELTSYTYDGLNRLTDVSEAQGDATDFSQHYTLNVDGTRGTSAESQLQPDGSTVTTDTTWTYDADGRLVGEAVTSNVSSDEYSDAYTYDLDNNRMQQVHTGPAGGADETITYYYNGDDELTSQTSSISGTTTNVYDANGSLTSSTIGGQTTTYTYDVRNKMVGYSDGTNSAMYVYDDDDDRVSETVNGVTTLYLTDTQNPTGYDQPLEATTSSSRITYILSDRILGQVNSSGTVTYLLVDGHGSTQQLTSASGAITAAFRYDAFGTALDFTPATAGTDFLFGGDAVYDSVSGLYLHGNGVRPTDGFEFIQRDTYAGNPNDPLSLHKYLYANADPVNGNDPSGHDDNELEDEAFSEANDDIAEDIGGYDAVDAALTGGIAEADADEDKQLAIGSLGISVWQGYAQAWQGITQNILLGAAGGFLGEAAEGFAAADEGVAGAESGAAEDLGEEESNLAEECEGGCFVAGTDVLLGDRKTEEAIQDIQVGQRVATDGGVANSPTGTAAADPNATQVDPKTWRLVTMEMEEQGPNGAEDIAQIQTLEPLSELAQENAQVGSLVAVPLDLAEMGLPDDPAASSPSALARPSNPVQGGLS